MLGVEDSDTVGGTVLKILFFRKANSIVGLQRAQAHITESLAPQLKIHNPELRKKRSVYC